MFLKGKKGLIVGIANDKSIATGCAKAMHTQGANLAITYLNEKAKRFVEPVANELNSELLLEMNLGNELQVDSVFEQIASKWGELDFLVHSVAFCPMADLHGRVTDCSKAGFLQAMDTSCYSLIELTKKAEPLMKNGGSIITLSYYGAEKVLENYNIMGPVKAALESTTRYLAAELGQKSIRVNAISSGPIATRAASGIKGFDNLLDISEKSPLGRKVNIDDVGKVATHLVSDNASGVTGGTHYVDAGLNIIGT